MVRFDGVTKVYRKGRLRFNPRLAIPGRLGDKLSGDLHVALEDIDLAVAPGAALGVIGQNGAGKSTLLKLVAGVIAPTSGRVTVNGRTAALIELGAGFHPEMTGRENVEFSAAILGMGRRRLREVLPDVIEFAAIGSYLDTPVKRYSSGMLARLGFAVASHLDADVLVIDEVLSVGDAAFQRRCYDRILERRAEGAAILYVTHALWTVPVVCDHALLLTRGRVVSRGSPEAVVRAYLEPTDGDGPDPLEETTARVTRLELDPSCILPGDRCVVSIELQLARAAPSGSLLVSIMSPSGNPYGTVSSAEAGVRFSAAGHFAITCALASAPLVPGDYEVWAIFRMDDDQPVVDAFRRTGLRVEGPEADLTRGVVALEAEWSASQRQ